MDLKICILFINFFFPLYLQNVFIFSTFVSSPGLGVLFLQVHIPFTKVYFYIEMFFVTSRNLYYWYTHLSVIYKKFFRKFYIKWFFYYYNIPNIYIFILHIVYIVCSPSHFFRIITFQQYVFHQYSEFLSDVIKFLYMIRYFVTDFIILLFNINYSVVFFILP